MTLTDGNSIEKETIKAVTETEQKSKGRRPVSLSHLISRTFYINDQKYYVLGKDLSWSQV